MRAECLGEQLTVDSIRRSKLLLYDYLEAGWIQKPTLSSATVNNKKSISVNGDGSQSSEGRFEVDDEKKLRDPKYLLELHGYDSSQWELVSSKNSFWDAQTKSDGIKTMYASKISVKPRSGLDYKEFINDLEKFSNTYVPKEVYPSQFKYGSGCLVPCLFDVHFSKLAAYDECNDKYDYKIAKERVINSIKTYIDKFKNRTFEKIIFAIGNDYFNSEASGSTVNNTPQDNDTRYSKMFNKGVETLIESIDLLSLIAPVEVVLVQGNHSFFTEYYASCVLKAWYKDSDFVSVDNSPTVRKYKVFGNNLIGFTHGSEERDRIYGLMQVEAAEDWGRCTGAKEWLVGHLHSEGVTEKNGVVVRRIPSLTGLDAWHVKSGYTTSKKRTMAFIYDKEEGLIETHYVNI